MNFTKEYNIEFYKTAYGEENYLKAIAQDYLNNTRDVIVEMFEGLVSIDNAVEFFAYLKSLSTDYKEILENRVEAKSVINK